MITAADVNGRVLPQLEYHFFDRYGRTNLRIVDIASDFLMMEPLMAEFMIGAKFGNQLFHLCNDGIAYPPHVSPNEAVFNHVRKIIELVVSWGLFIILPKLATIYLHTINLAE